MRRSKPWVRGVLLLAAIPVAHARADDETRRQVMSTTIDHVFNLTGNGVVLGQIEPESSSAHNNIALTRRLNDPANELHPLQVAGVMVSTHATHTGMAPGASLFQDATANNGIAAGGGGSAGENNGMDAIFWQMKSPSACAINASYGFSTTTFSSDGLSKISKGIDWAITQPRATGGDFLFVKSAGNNGTTPTTVPGDVFNGLTVGGVTSDDYRLTTTSPLGPVNRRWGVLANFSSWSTATTLAKPDLVAPASRVDTDAAEVGFNLPTVAPANGWAAQNGAAFVGTSYAAPHVTGVAAQLYQLVPNADHRLMKAVLMNSADKTVRSCTHGGGMGTYFRNNDPPWTAGAFGLDAQTGTGMLDAWGATAQLLCNKNVSSGIGTLANGSDKEIASVKIGPDTRVVATVVWDRAITVDAVAVPGETYTVAGDQPHYGLSTTGAATLSQNTAGGSVQHINQIVSGTGDLKIKVANNGAAAGRYAVAWAVSPVDVNPGTQDVYFTVRDQIHRPRAENVAPTNVDDRVREGRTGTRVREISTADGARFANGVESRIYKSTMNVGNTEFKDGTALGLMEVAGANPDDSISDISFGRDATRRLSIHGGQKVWFSVDPYATGLSSYGVDNPESGVFSEATVVREAAGDIFQSNTLAAGAGPITNQNKKTKNSPNTDYLKPTNNKNNNTTYADSYYMGLNGPTVADREDDVAGLEGLGQTVVDGTNGSPLADNFIFFTLDRGSPSGHTADIMVARKDMPGVPPHVFATAAQLGLNDTDHVDGLMVQVFSNLDGGGWPVFNRLQDDIIFSIDRDSNGKNGTAVRSESTQGEAPGDLFYVPASTADSNLLFLEATDLGLQEFNFGNGQNFMSDNLDALDIPDAINTAPRNWMSDTDDALWSQGSNWSDGTPPGSSSDLARFDAVITAPRTVVNDALHTVQAIEFGSGHTFTIAGKHSIVLTSAATEQRASIRVFRGNHTITAPIAINSNLELYVGPPSGKITLAGAVTASEPDKIDVRKIGYGVAELRHARFRELDVAGGSVVILPNGANEGASRLHNLILGGETEPTTRLDLTNNSLVLTDTPRETVQKWILHARGDGTWTGEGLTSSTAAANLHRSTTLAVMSGAEHESIYGATADFAGFDIASTDTLVKYVRFGDADFSGSVELDDYNRIDQGFGDFGSGWSLGDFDSDGLISFDDYALIDIGFNDQLGTLRRAIDWLSGDDRSLNGTNVPGVQIVQRHLDEFGPGYAMAFVSAVPEPASCFGAILFMSLSVLNRRRRRIELPSVN